MQGIHTVLAITETKLLSFSLYIKPASHLYLICVTIMLIATPLTLYYTEWTTEGCGTDLPEANGDVVTCSCSHLTNFAVLSKCTFIRHT